MEVPSEDHQEVASHPPHPIGRNLLSVEVTDKKGRDSFLIRRHSITSATQFQLRPIVQIDDRQESLRIPTEKVLRNRELALAPPLPASHHRIIRGTGSSCNQQRHGTVGASLNQSLENRPILLAAGQTDLGHREQQNSQTKSSSEATPSTD